MKFLFRLMLLLQRLNLKTIVKLTIFCLIEFLVRILIVFLILKLCMRFEALSDFHQEASNFKSLRKAVFKKDYMKFEMKFEMKSGKTLDDYIAHCNKVLSNC
jgi:hypothetical protein